MMNPTQIRARLAEAITAHGQGRLADAHRAYTEILQSDPAQPTALQNLGVLFLQVGQHAAAIPLLQGAIRLDPRNAGLHCNLGDALAASLQAAEAMAAYRRALALNPALAPAWNNLGILASRVGRLSEAIDAWEQAFQHAGAPGPAGQQVLVRAGADPATALRAAIANNLGNAWLQRMQPERARQWHQRALELDPGSPGLHSNLLRDLMHLDLPADQVLTEHRAWWRRRVIASAVAYPNPREPERTLRIGFVSGDFREHAVACFLLPLFEHHDRQRYHYYCYGEVARPDAWTQRLTACTQGYRSTLGLSDAEVARIIRADEIDLLIDLSGHTSDNRLTVFAARPAPVQLTWLGSPATTGAPRDLIRYRLTDALADPPGISDAHCSEELVRLHTNWCYTPLARPACAERPPVMAQPGRPFTFASFSNSSKISNVCLDLWARVLTATPGSRLLLKSWAFADAATRAELEARFAAAGVDSERLVLMQAQADPESHLSYYREADLALDTFPYHGTTTTLDALWMNVPVLTLAGSEHRARVGVSLMTHVGMPELIAADADAYVATAARMAQQIDQLAALRSGLRARLQASALMDGPAFARDFDATLRGLWRRWCEGE